MKEMNLSTRTPPVAPLLQGELPPLIAHTKPFTAESSNPPLARISRPAPPESPEQTFWSSSGS